MHLNPHTILPLFCMLLALICGAFVIRQNPKAKLNQIFFTLCLALTAWFSIYIPIDSNCSNEFLLNWFKISYCFICFIPISCFTFVTTYLKASKNELWFKINLAIGTTFSILSVSTDWLLKGIVQYPWYRYPLAGPLHPFFVFHCIYLNLFGIKLMFDGMNNPSLSFKQRNHLKYMFAAMIVGNFGILDFLGNYHIPLYHTGYISVSAYLIITSIAIIRHQLMDIQVVIRKSLIYSTLITLITLIFLVLVLIIEKLSQNYIGHNNLLNSVILSIFVALVFIPLKNKIQTSVDRIFFKGTQLEIAQENTRLREELTHTEKMRTIALIASGLAHEIKNPITAIQTFTEYLPQKRNDSQFIDQYTRIVSQEAKRINDLIHELLDFSKPSEPKFESIDPNLLIQDIIKLLSPQIARANIQTNIQLTDTSTIQADPSQLKQALLNIIMNAIDAMPNGGTLGVIARSPEGATKQSFIIEISDTGHGIDPKDLPHIFEPFFTKKEKGTGLGLAITQGIIEKHNGKISVHSQLNKGTIFIINFYIYAS